MQIFTTLEQSKRLKDAGFPLKEILPGEYQNVTATEIMEDK